MKVLVLFAALLIAVEIAEAQALLEVPPSNIVSKRADENWVRPTELTFTAGERARTVVWQIESTGEDWRRRSAFDQFNHAPFCSGINVRWTQQDPDVDFWGYRWGAHDDDMVALAEWNKLLAEYRILRHRYTTSRYRRWEVVEINAIFPETMRPGSSVLTIEACAAAGTPAFSIPVRVVEPEPAPVAEPKPAPAVEPEPAAALPPAGVSRADYDAVVADRDRWLDERNRLLGELAEIERERDAAIAERDDAIEERDAARVERDDLQALLDLHGEWFQGIRLHIPAGVEIPGVTDNAAEHLNGLDLRMIACEGCPAPHDSEWGTPVWIRWAES